MSSRRSWITFHDEDAEKEAEEEAKDHFHRGHRTQALFDHDFKFYWMLHYICLCFLGAIMIHVIDEVYFIDAVFHAVSAMTGAGLSTIPMYRFTKPTFCIFAFLMYFGSPSFMLLPTILYRRHCFARLNQQIFDHLQKKKSSLTYRDLLPPEQQVIQEYKQLDHALSVLAYIILFYNILVITCGVLILNATLRIKDLQVELQQRHFSYLDNAVYLTISAFANAGCSITSDSLMSMADNPCAYLLLSCLILAGNTALPICLRFLIASILRFENILIFLFYPRYDPKKPDAKVESKRAKYRRTLQYILNNPRRLTTHLFSNLQTKVLAFMISFLIIIQYIFFLGATMNRDSARIEHSKSALAGIGYFQTISVRSAGFTIMDLRLLNQGLLVVYCVMMYISSFPFVSVLESSVHKEDDRKISIQQQQTAADKVTLVDELQPSSESDSRVHALESSQHSYEGSDMSYSTNSESTDYGDGDHVNVVAIQKKFVVTYFYRHSFFLLSAILILAFSEDRMLYDRTMNVNLWYIFFEVISAYGDVGLSLGIEGKVYSLSGAMTAVGKCVIIFIMLLGKHRGLPNKKDDVIDFQFNRYRAAWRYHHHHHNHHHHEVDEGLEQQSSQLLGGGMTSTTKRSHTSVKVKQHKTSSERSYASYFFSSKRDNHDKQSARSIFPWSNKTNPNSGSSDKVSYNPLVVKSVE